MSKKGYTLVEVLVGVAIIATVSVIVAGSMVKVNQIRRQMDIGTSAARIEELIRGNLTNNSSWYNTVTANENESLNCLRIRQSLRDCSGGGGSFSLYDISGIRVLDPINQGMSLTGEACSPLGQGDCLFKIGLRWNAKCPASGTCPEPLIEFETKIEYAGNEQVNFSSDKHSLTFIRGGDLNTLSRSCESVGGVFDAATYQCVLLGLAGNCPSGQVVVQVTEAMNKVCRPVFRGACSSSQYMIGINSNGTPRCSTRPLCPPPPPPPITTLPPGVGGTSPSLTPGENGGDSSITPGDSEGGSSNKPIGSDSSGSGSASGSGSSDSSMSDGSGDGSDGASDGCDGGGSDSADGACGADSI